MILLSNGLNLMMQIWEVLDFCNQPDIANLGSSKIVEKNQNKFDDCNLGMFKFVEQT